MKMSHRVSKEEPTSTALMDSTGAAVRIKLEAGHPIRSYTVSLDGESAVGKATFYDPPGAGNDRIFFHTEVDDEFGGRGLARLLVRAALADSIRQHVTVVPVCPVFARHLRIHGSEYVEGGGALRRPTPADFEGMTRAVRAGA